jgi:hypothetical protein
VERRKVVLSIYTAKYSTLTVKKWLKESGNRRFDDLSKSNEDAAFQEFRISKN